MNNALQYHLQVSARNLVRRTLRKPLKAIGLTIFALYFLFLPFILKDTITAFGINSPKGFVLANSVMSVYISMPVVLSYFKRNGIAFKKPDVNFMMATPVPPKQILVYALFKQSYMTLLMQCAGIIAAIFVFEIPVGTALIYGLGTLIFSNLLQYSLAVIMYGSERLSENFKKNSKYVVYAILLSITLFFVYYFYKNGLSVAAAFDLVNHPIILAIPIFGWELGWLNLVILGPTTPVLITSVLFFISAIVLGYIAFNMQCTGDYYEDAMKFSQLQARIVEKKGNVSFNEMRGKKRKTFKFNGKIKGTFAQVTFSRQWIERRRTRKFFLSFGDLVILAASIFAGYMMRDKPIDSSKYFAIACGVSMYFAIFFAPNPSWKNEYTNYFLFIIPDTMWRKLLYSTLLEQCLSLIQSILLAVPLGLFVGAPISVILFAIIAQWGIKVMINYKAILIEGYFGAKIGQGMAVFVSMFVSIILLLIPIVSLVSGFYLHVSVSFAIITAYTLVMSGVLMYLCTRVLTNIESLN